MEKFLSSSVEVKSEEVLAAATSALNKSEPVPKSPEKRGRKRREPLDAAVAEPQPKVPRIKIRFGGKPAEDHDADEASTEVNGSSSTSDLPSTSTESVSRKSDKKSKKKKALEKPAFSWYDKLPSLEELEARTQTSLPSGNQPDSPTDPATWKFRERTVILMPYLDNYEPDFLHYDFPDKERFMAKKRVF